MAKTKKIKRKEEKTEKKVRAKREDSLPFPMATVVRHIRDNSDGRMISAKVKVATNQFLGDMMKVVSREMSKTRYSMIEMDDFQRATKPFTFAKELEAEKQRVVRELEKMRSDIESLIREFQRKFKIEATDQTHVLITEDTEDKEK